MGIRADFRKWILSISEVKRLVEDDLWPGIVPVDVETPCGSYARDDLEVLGQRLAGGAGGDTVGMLLEWEGTSEECERLADEVRRAIKELKGPIQMGDTFVHSMRITAEVDGWQQLGDGDEKGKHTTTMHIVVTHDGGAK
jgi:hypothetical protein